jgi:hypothetical protein
VIGFDSFWQAGRFIDEQIDSELRDRAGNLLLARWFNIALGWGLCKTGINFTEHWFDISKGLKRVRCEEKVIAKLVFEGVWGLCYLPIDEAGLESVRFLLGLAHDFMLTRIKNNELIIRALKGNYIAELREKVAARNQAIDAEVETLRKLTREGKYCAAASRIERRLLKGRYLKEPEFNGVEHALQQLRFILTRRGPPRPELINWYLDFILRKSRLSHHIAQFMQLYRDEFIQRQLKLSSRNEKVLREFCKNPQSFRDAHFAGAFKKFLKLHPKVEFFSYWWLRMQIAAFVNP